jgi:hypothetical protein
LLNNQLSNRRFSQLRISTLRISHRKESTVVDLQTHNLERTAAGSQQNVEEALKYAELGYRVFPCATGAKHPITPHGFHDGTTNLGRVAEFWRQSPEANLGLVTQGLLVIDIDGADNPWLQDDPDKLYDLSKAPLSRTANGGRHYIFRQPEGKNWKCTTGQLANKVDTRANGGYIIVPPSQLENGNTYKWVEGNSLDRPFEELPEPPDWLTKQLDELHTSRPASSRRQTEGGASNDIPSGQRNSTLFSLAGAMRNNGMGAEEILAAISITNQKRCKPPLSEVEVARIVGSMSRYEADPISVARIENHWEQLVGNTSQNSDLSDPGPFPEELLHVPEFIDEVVQYDLKTAFRPQPELSLAAALTLLATLTGQRITDHSGTRTNLYSLGVCPSGGGKERTRQVNKDILGKSGLGAYLGPEGIASHAGLFNAVEEQPVILFQLDEIGRFLKTLHDSRNSPHLFNVITMLMKMYTNSGSVFKSDAYADTAKNKTINHPHACLYGTTVPESLYDGLTPESLTNGFLSRMLIFEASNPDPEMQEVTMIDPPDSILETALWWSEFQPGTSSQTSQIVPLVVQYTEEGRITMNNLEAEAQKQRQKASEFVRTMWSRTTEKARKLALLYACSVNHEQPIVDLEAANWAASLSDYLTRKMIFTAEQWVSENPFEQQRKRVMRTVRDAGEGGISKTKLNRATKHLKSPERDEILKSLIEAKEIEEQKTSTGGAPRKVYQAI